MSPGVFWKNVHAPVVAFNIIPGFDVFIKVITTWLKDGSTPFMSLVRILPKDCPPIPVKTGQACVVYSINFAYATGTVTVAVSQLAKYLIFSDLVSNFTFQQVY
jgi:hypothetical protein